MKNTTAQDERGVLVIELGIIVLSGFVAAVVSYIFARKW